MTPAIRIIKAQKHPVPQLLELEREEQIAAVALRIAEASGYVSQEKMDACASKLRHISETINGQDTEILARSIASKMMTPGTAPAFTAHADLDIDRIMELLEG